MQVLRVEPVLDLAPSAEEWRRPGIPSDPASREAEPRIRGALPSAEEVRPGPATILVVDDQPDILESLRMTLEASLPGVRVVVADSAREGLRVLAEQRVDLLITDLRMPEMDGLEFIRNLRRSQPDLPVVLMTAYVRSELADRAREAQNFQEFLDKPLDPRRIVAVAQRYLAA